MKYLRELGVLRICGAGAKIASVLRQTRLYSHFRHCGKGSTCGRAKENPRLRNQTGALKSSTNPDEGFGSSAFFVSACFSSKTCLVGGAFGIETVAIDEFDDRHGRHVAVAEAGFQDANIAALTVFVAGAKDVKQVSLTYWSCFQARVAA